MMFPMTAFIRETASLPPALLVNTTLVLTVVGMLVQMMIPETSSELIGEGRKALAMPHLSDRVQSRERVRLITFNPKNLILFDDSLL